MARDLIGERAAQLAANRAKPTVPYLPDLSPKAPTNAAAYKGFRGPVFQRSLWLNGLKLWQSQGYTKEDFERHVAEYNKKASG
jgi:hypothetical protein